MEGKRPVDLKEEIDNDIKSVYEWLTIGHLEKIFRKYKNDENIKIVKFSIVPAILKGENYASVVKRVHVTSRAENGSAELREDSFILKTPHENDPFVVSTYNPYHIFETEMRMYDDVLPNLAKLLQEAGDHDKLFANTIHVDYIHSAILLEDMSAQKYVVADRISGMDVKHSKLALRKLAKMHAAAAVLNERTSGTLQSFDRGIFNRYTAGFAPYFCNMIEVCADFARGCENLGSYYADKLMALKPFVIEYATRVYEPSIHHFNTLAHGDFWINNVLLRYANDNSVEKSIADIVLIDFQFCVWASPAVDLHYFFNTSLKGDLRLHNQEELVNYYHHIISETLRKLKYTGNIPTLPEFRKQLEEGQFYAVTSALAVQPILVNEKTEDADFKTLMMEDEKGKRFRRLVYSNPIVQEYVKDLLPVFDRKGLLDIKN